MAILVEDQLHSGAWDKQLKHSYSYATISLMHPRGNCYIRELESPQTHPTLGLREARAGILWSGRDHILLGEVHQGIHGQRRIPKTPMRPHREARLLGIPQLPVTELASLPHPARLHPPSGRGTCRILRQAPPFW